MDCKFRCTPCGSLIPHRPDRGIAPPSEATGKKYSGLEQEFAKKFRFLLRALVIFGA
jgi:hypothetical protein